MSVSIDGRQIKAFITNLMNNFKTNNVVKVSKEVMERLVSSQFFEG